MRVAQVQFATWDKVYNFSLGPNPVKVGDYVIVDTKLGLELAKIISFSQYSDQALKALSEPLKPILRLASKEELEDAVAKRKNKPATFETCYHLIKKHNLPIKLVDVQFSLDDSKLCFAFIADGRIDFRELLKDLNKTFKKSIRLQQIGIRDEIKVSGDVGCCGRDLCCQTFQHELGNVTSDLADLQQVSHRGSDRLSGVCGRLKCCLTFEQALYHELANKLPLIGDSLATPNGQGQVIGWHVLRQSVDVLLQDGETVVEFSLAEK